MDYVKACKELNARAVKDKVVSFDLDKEAIVKAQRFIQAHGGCVCNSASGGKFSYIFTQDAIGLCQQIRCNACLKVEDLGEEIF